MSKMKGVVKFFNDTKGFGFIKEEETSTEYFVHATNLIDEIREDDAVAFDVEDGRKGPVAVNVEVTG